MPAKIIDGKAMALSIRASIAARVFDLRSKGVTPGLAVVLVGENPASQVYVKMKRKACAEAGIASFAHDLHHDVSEDALLDLIARLNSDPAVHGVLVQLPLPTHIDEKQVTLAISPDKDVDGFHPVNVGLLALGEPCFAPCTPAGVIELIESTGAKIEGANAVVIGRSNIVGKPTAMMLMKRNATVTVCHSKTKDLAAEVGRADIVVAAIGRPAFVKGSWIKPQAVVVDVGINRLPDGGLAGDVEFAAAAERASAITPVPGGVGPMTIAMLLKNTVEAASRSL
ncbi:MAG: bifunctional methylenetetrahydrofolate dehydrogenase/methenyltetrahydrofolate cyclohydrolase FolD [Proteobacteria bacterium]|nr:bifunctional methylenetetrahydrofolate dehydrogenase/methenyltetrahydrofolate cyclohydrolase FolD [Pseudomonadota bacterium]